MTIFWLKLAVDLLALEFFCRVYPECRTARDIADVKWWIEFFAGATFTTLIAIGITN